MLMVYNRIDGWFDAEKLYDQAVADARENDVFVEVGCWKGKSTAYMAQKIKESRKKIQFYAVDTWEGSMTEEAHQSEIAKILAQKRTLFEEFWQMMKIAGVSEIIYPIKRDSVEAANSCFADRTLSFVFIDADHRYENVTADIKAWYPKVRPGGVLAGHDFAWDEVNRAVKDFCFDRNYTPNFSAPASWWIKKI